MKKIGSLTVLKFAAMLLIVWWHLGNPTRNIDLGARMCEFLFVASGFLVGYNYYVKGMPDSRKYSFDYTFGKIKKAWPLHVLVLFALLVLDYKTYLAEFTFNSLSILISNVFLLHAWSPDIENVAFAYRGVSWFLSALLFCYFLSPFFIKFIKKISVSIVAFIVVACLRVLIDIFIMNSSNIFWLSTHTSPIVRALEFFIGMLIVPTFIKVKGKICNIENLVSFKIIATFIEISVLIGCYFIMYGFDKTWQRSYFVLIFCAVVFIFGFDCGYFSKVCTNKYVNFVAGIQLEMFLLQIAVSVFVNKIFILMGIQMGNMWTFIIKLTVLFLISFAYKYLLENRLAKGLDKVYEYVKKKCFN